MVRTYLYAPQDTATPWRIRGRRHGHYDHGHYGGDRGTACAGFAGVAGFFLVQDLRSRFYLLQGWQGCLRTLEDETPLELPPGASLSQTLAFHNQVSDET